MARLIAAIVGLLNQMRGRRLDRDTDAEFAFHIDSRAAELERRGLPPDRARRQARIEFGGVEAQKERVREARGFPLIESLVQDLRYAVRSYRRTPLFALVAVTTLTLAIGANTAVFSLLNALILRELPVRDPASLVQVSTLRPPSFADESGVSLPMFEELLRRQSVFSTLIPWRYNGTMNVEAPGQTLLGNVWAVGGNFHSELASGPALGRLLSDDDVNLGALRPAQVAVLGYGFWQRHFSGDPAAVGTTVRLEDVPFTIVGVAPRGFTGLGLTQEPDVTVPLTALPLLSGRRVESLRTEPFLSINVTARLRTGVSLAQARAQLASVWPAVKEQALPASLTGPQRDAALSTRLSVSAAATGFEPRLRREYTQPLLIVMGIALLILAIACVNLASLTLSRTSTRRREMGLRVALGASRWRLGRQMLTENLLLSAIGATAGLGFAYWSSRAIVTVIFADSLVPASFNATPDGRAVAFAILAAIVTAVLTSLGSAWRIVGRSASAAMAHGARSIAGMDRAGTWLIAAQVALSLILLTHAGLLVRTLGAINAVDSGLRPAGVTVVYPTAKPGGYRGVNNDSYYPEVLERMAALPGVEHASISLMKPAGGGPGFNEIVSAAGETAAFNGGIGSTRTPIAPGFFQTLGIPLLAGRDFEWHDNSHGRPVTILSESLARTLFADRTAVGQRVRFGVDSARQNVEVVGVAADARLYDLKSSNLFAAYMPALQDPAVNFKCFVLKGRNIAFNDVRRMVESLGQERVRSAQTLDDVTGRALMKERITAALAAFFGLLALVLAAIGLFGLISHSVTCREREIGIRVALGARTSRVVSDVLWDGVRVTSIGVGAGLVATLMSVRVSGSLLFGVTPHDPRTLLAAVASLAAVAVVASLFPAARAARVDPMIALRAE